MFAFLRRSRRWLPMLKAALVAAIPLVTVLPQAHARSLADIRSSGELRVGFEPGFLPFEMKLPSGEWVGFDVDMMKGFAKHLGVQAVFIDTKWDGIIPALMAKKFDVIVSGMTITDDRRKVVAFSDPYYDAGLVALIPKNRATTWTSLSDLDRPELRIAVKQGTTGDFFVKKSMNKAQIIKLESEADAASSVILGKTDAFIYDKPFLTLYQSLNPGRTVVLKGLLSQEQFGVAARPADKELLDAFNTWLANWRKTGGYKDTMTLHFETMPWKSSLGKLW